jgi:signal transduction histidine kinase
VQEEVIVYHLIKKILMVACCFLLAVTAVEDKAVGRPAPLQFKGNSFIPNAKQVAYFEDKQGLLDVDAVINLEESFKINDKDDLSFGFTTSAYWFWLELANGLDEEQTSYLEVMYPLLDHIDLYYFDKNGQRIQYYNTGDRYAFSNRPVNYTNFVFPLKLAPGSTHKVLVRVQTEGALQVPFHVWSYDKFSSSSRNYVLFQGLWAGALMVMVFYNLFVFFSVRRLSYLIYILQITSYIIFTTTLNGFFFQYAMPDSPGFVNAIVGVSITITNMFVALFTIGFLNLNKTSKWAFRYMMALGGWSGLLAVADRTFLPYSISVPLATISASVVFGSALVVGIFRLTAGQKEARFFVVAWVVYILGAIALSLAKLGLLPVTFLTTSGIQIGSILEALLLSFALADKLNTLKAEHDKALEEKRKAQDELLAVQKEHIQTLDRKVEEKTKAIQTILKNVKNGFLLVNRHGEIQSGFTESCHILFGQNITAGSMLTQYLSLSPRDVESFGVALSQVFDDRLPEVITLAQLPELYAVNGKTLSLQGALIRGGQHEAQYIMFTVTDKSKQIEAERRSEQNEALLKIIRSKESFRMVLLDFVKTIDQVKIGHFPTSSWKLYLHTLKGIFSCYGLQEIAHKIHEIEDRTEISADEWLQIEKLTMKFYEENREVIDIDLSREGEAARNVMIPSESLLNMYVDLKSCNSRQDWGQKVDFWFSELSGSPVGVFVGELASYAESLAQRLGKKVRVVIEGGDTRISHPEVVNVIKNLVHLVRNSIDHGIEFRESRSGKSEVGEIRISFQKENDRLVIKVKDDGHGFDFEAIKDRAVKLGYLQSGDLLSDEECFKLLAKYSISTRDKVSDISGRGVGVRAIIEAVEKVGGLITLNNRPGLFSEITISLDLASNVVIEERLKVAG